MASYIIRHEGELQRVNSLEGYESAELLQTLEEEPAHDFFTVDENDNWIENVTAAEVVALEEAERSYCNASEQDVKHVRRQIGVMFLWEELCRLKQAETNGTIPGTAAERYKQFPTLVTLSSLSGTNLTITATAVENRLWDRVRRISLWHAKLLMAHDNIRAAPTVQQKLESANIDWSE